MQCPDCNHENRTGTLVCDSCSADLYDMLVEQVETKQLQRHATRKLKLDEPASSRPVMLYIGNQTPLVIERRNGQIIGRKDLQNNAMSLHIDLTDYNGQRQGVSRQHARIDARSLPPVLMDLGSYNGTYVNGVKLNADQPYPLESSDEIRLGRLIVRIYYK